MREPELEDVWHHSYDKLKMETSNAANTGNMKPRTRTMYIPACYHYNTCNAVYVYRNR